MDRRSFVRGLFGVAAASAVVATAGISAAEAAPMPVSTPVAPNEAERVQGDYRPEVDGAPVTEKAQYYYRRRYRPRRRVVYYRRPRRVYYRPRRVIYRRRYRPVYYRPRYVW